MKLTVFLGLFYVVVSGIQVYAYAEEDLRFRDPLTAQLSDDLISTIHSDLTFALALAAGFTVDDAATMLVWDQLVDTEIIGPELTPWYSGCLGSFPEPPDPAGICDGSVDTSIVAWPLYSAMKDPETCVFSRFGPYSPFFHFPRFGDEITAIRDWAMGNVPELVGYEAYAWGGPTVMTATCTLTRPSIIDTGLAAGSLEAFSVYIHSLGDSWSHKNCIEDLDSLDPPAPWPTHTLLAVTQDETCRYNPASPDNQDVHGREFGFTYPLDSFRTIQGAFAIYGEMMNRSDWVEGQYEPMTMDTVLEFMDGTPTLEEAIRFFIVNWTYDEPASRRSYADEMAAAILAQRRQAIIEVWPAQSSVLELSPLVVPF
jgi:hypothetical protein